MRVFMISKALLVGTYQTKLEALAKQPGVELHVAVPPYWGWGQERLELERAHIDGYTLHVTPMVLNGRFHWHAYPRLRGLLRDIMPDIVHIDEEPYNLATWQAMRLAKRCGCRALFFTWQNLRRRYPLPFRWMEQYNYAHADYALAGNAQAIDVLRAKGYVGPVALIPQFGIDPALFQPGDKGAGGDKPLTFGYVGRLVPEKGVDLLLRAAARLEEEWRIQIVGAGPEQERLTALATELGIADRVALRPWMPSGDVPGFLSQLDVLVLPSRTRPNWMEQFGRILVEAMACGVAVVGSDSGEIPNVIGDGGLVFPEGDVAALTACLEALRDPALRQSLGARARARVVARYTQSQIARQTYRVYQEMLSMA